MPERELTPTEQEDLRIARQAYAIFRGGQRKGSENFPHHWDGLPQHYHDLLAFVVAHARGGL